MIANSSSGALSISLSPDDPLESPRKRVRLSGPGSLRQRVILSSSSSDGEDDNSEAEPDRQEKRAAGGRGDEKEEQNSDKTETMESLFFD